MDFINGINYIWCYTYLVSKPLKFSFSGKATKNLWPSQKSWTLVIKLLSFSRYKVETFSICWKIFCEILQNFNSFSSFRQFLFSFFLSVFWLSLDFMRFHETCFGTDTKNFSILSWKTKKFIPKRIWFMPLCLNRPWEIQQMAYLNLFSYDLTPKYQPVSLITYFILWYFFG